jgi:hypothetical protein
MVETMTTTKIDQAIKAAKKIEDYWLTKVTGEDTYCAHTQSGRDIFRDRWLIQQGYVLGLKRAKTLTKTGR